MSRDVALDYRWALHCLEHIEELVVVTDAALGSAGEGGPYVRYVNAAFERSTGWPRAEVLGQPLRRLGGVATAESTRAQIRAAYRRGQATEVELDTERRDGSAMRLRSRLLPLRDAQGALQGFLFLQSDRTDARAMQLEQSRLNDWFAGAAASALSALYITSAQRDAAGSVVDFRIEYANVKGGELLQQDPRALVGQVLRECLPGSRTEVLIGHCRRVLETGQAFVEEFEVPEYPAGLRWMRHQVVPLRDGVAVTAENISDRKQTEAMLQAFLHHWPGRAWISDTEGNILAANAAYAEVLASRGARQLPTTLRDCYSPELAALYLQNNRRIDAGGVPEHLLEPGLRADGSRGLFETCKFPLGEQGGRRLLGGFAMDITEREGERQTAERLAAIVRSSGDAILSLDLQGHIVSWNLGAERLFGFSEAEAIGRPVSMLAAPEDRESAAALLKRVLSGEPQVRAEAVRVCRDGSAVQVQLSLSPIIDRDGRCVGVSKIATDIGERHRRELQTRYFAEHDPVTGALNERGLLLTAQAWIDSAPARPLALLRLRVERFGEFRDVFGMTHAHALLGQVVERLATCFDGTASCIAHFGQDDFALLLELPADDALLPPSLVEQLQQVQLLPLDVLGIEFDLELRAGLACYPQDAAGGEALLRCADLAISAGRRGLSRYDAAMGERVAYQVRLQRELARALGRGQLRLVMQPIVESRPPHRALGLEVLLRWRHPELGDIPPARFIPVAEESGLIAAIGGFVIEEACRLKAWLTAEGFGQLFVSLNVSPDQFRHGDLPARVSAALGRHGLPGAGMELEITESTLMEQTEHSAQQLQALAALGLGLSIDDFGTGWSSLAYLHRFPLTKLKVDRSFVAGLPQDHGAAAIVRSILTLARSLELSTLAEGVETEAQQALLSGLGCAQLQGFLHSPPLEATDFLDWLRARG
ncbi:EAL domain-containing protein [uncultured Aquimonas sp.]|uniref:sensor domain-containing protein n=1 Tax=uncultured Aquimonas sp. TaxID=385483 RepID=UPI000869962E|nr:EAL domain-containing protein [uncultured Aquimonas sp.]ODU46221.1 MAG: hypothetical protein ABS96_09985 [Xanthomonadaceae bacterium SCN 69-123]